MKIEWKKAVGLAAAVAMLVPMAACGANGGDSNASGESKPSQTQSANLTVWGPSEDSEWLKDMEEAFGKAHPEYKVTWKNSVVAEGDAAKTVKTDPTAAADVYMFANDQLGDLLNQNAIAPVNDVVAQQVKEQNSQTMVDSVTGTDGKIYGVPYTSNTYFMYYNKDKFSADDVKSLDTMLEKGKVAYPLQNSWYIPAFYLGAGMTMFGSKGTDAKAGIDFGPNADAVSESLVKLVANPNFTNDDGTLGLAGLKNGTLDAYFSGSWDAANVQKALGDKYGAATVPTFKAGGKDYQMKALAGSKAIGMNPNTKAPEVASAFAAFLGSTEAQKKHWEMRQIIPSDKTLTNLEGMSTSPYVQAQLDTIAKTSVAQPTISAMAAWWTPAETFGKALVSKQVNDGNVKQKTADFMASVKKDVANKQ